MNLYRDFSTSKISKDFILEVMKNPLTNVIDISTTIECLMIIKDFSLEDVNLFSILESYLISENNLKVREVALDIFLKRLPEKVKKALNCLIVTED